MIKAFFCDRCGDGFDDLFVAVNVVHDFSDVKKALFLKFPVSCLIYVVSLLRLGSQGPPLSVIVRFFDGPRTGCFAQGEHVWGRAGTIIQP